MMNRLPLCDCLNKVNEGEEIFNKLVTNIGSYVLVAVDYEEGALNEALEALVRLPLNRCPCCGEPYSIVS